MSCPFAGASIHSTDLSGASRGVPGGAAGRSQCQGVQAMHFVFVRRAVCLVGVALACSLATAPAQGQTKDTPAGAAAVRKALDQKITLDFSSQNLDEAIDHLR